MKKANHSQTVIVTGLSGAGMSSVLKTLEDFGLEVFDNFPLSLVDPLMTQKDSKKRPMAIGIDTRTRGFSTKAVLQTVKKLDAQLLFITCDEAVLHKRFTETRRRHPLAKDRPVSVGIRQEQEALKDIKAKADLVMDTTDLSVHDLRHILEGHFDLNTEEQITVTLMSFAFRQGLPREADIVMDVRFLKNPHWDKKLKPKTGLDKAVGDYIRKDEAFESFLENLKGLLKPLLPRYVHEGKSYLTIAIGCTGGRHRSVYTVEELGKWLKAQDYLTHIDHRDLS